MPWHLKSFKGQELNGINRRFRKQNIKDEPFYDAEIKNVLMKEDVQIWSKRGYN